jgi:hypothetical protein
MMKINDYIDLLNDDLPDRDYILRFGGQVRIVTKERFIRHMVTMYKLVYKDRLKNLKLN